MIPRKVVWSHILLLLLGCSGLFRFVPRRWRKAGIQQVTHEEMAHMDEFMARQEERSQEINARLQRKPVRFAFFIALHVLRPIFDREGYKRTLEGKNIARGSARNDR